jgi:gas vesicle protein
MEHRKMDGEDEYAEDSDYEYVEDASDVPEKAGTRCIVPTLSTHNEDAQRTGTPDDPRSEVYYHNQLESALDEPALPQRHTEDSLRQLCADLHAQLESVSGNAAAAREELDAFCRLAHRKAQRRSTEIFRAGSKEAAEQYASFSGMIMEHVSDVLDEINRAEVLKRAAIEAELVAADNAIVEVMETRVPAARDALLTALLTRLPLGPVEPASIHLRPIEDGRHSNAGIFALLDIEARRVFAPSCVCSADVRLRDRPSAFVASGYDAAFSLELMGDAG